ncbi:D(4) dopamine receptor [Liparis tanakae]|uniref:D(4) dopamine receptor n=1 Tax=Liparis tanakae TaxID=230148 RepID=A0A4Z2FTY6_9TELE|nr:D(4) dopamine receptor [Liparis tanakae]
MRASRPRCSGPGSERRSRGGEMETNLSAASAAPEAAARAHNVPALLLGVLLIVVVTCGNLLVCLSVFTEKALKTTTNYFIVSLAVADLMLAVLVLPLFVYSEVRPHARASTGGFIAVLIPLNYNRKHVDLRQAALLWATWIAALAVASPLMFGINNVPGREPAECKLENDDYVLYSSVCSFFIPCPIMLLLYCGMFRGLRRWEEARKAKLRSSIQACRKLQEAAASLPPLASLPPPPPPPPVKEREPAARPDEPAAAKPFPPSSGFRDGPVPTVSFAEIKFNQDPRRRTTAKINSRERKAMKVLPIVVGAFLFCWTPFFVLHTMRARCQDCRVPPALMSVVTWLGYVNSALNPVIYTVFNTEFRKFFKRFLHRCCSTGAR